MRKVGKVEVYNNWSGIILSSGLNYKFRKDDIISGDVKIGDEVTFIPEKYPHDENNESELAARFVKKKELSI